MGWEWGWGRVKLEYNRQILNYLEVQRKTCPSAEINVLIKKKKTTPKRLVSVS